MAVPAVYDRVLASNSGVFIGSTFSEPTLRWQWKPETTRLMVGPLVTANAIYVGDDSGVVSALNPTNGEILWSAKLDDPIAATPVVVDDFLLVGTEFGALHALQIADGSSRWVFWTGGKVAGGPRVWSTEGKRALLVFGSYDSFVYAVHADDGTKAWQYETNNYLNGSAAIIGDRAFVGGCDGKLYAFELPTGKLLWASEIGGYVAGAVAADVEAVYLGHYQNEVVAVNLEEGTIRWKYKGRNFPYVSSPALLADRLILGCRDRNVIALDRNTGELLWATRTGSRVDGSPLVIGDAAFIGSDDGRIYAFDVETGDILWEYEAGRPVNSPLHAQGKTLAGIVSDGRLLVFDLPIAIP